MKKLFTIIGILMLCHLNAQNISTQLDHNNISANLSTIGAYFYDGENYSRGYEVPKGSGLHSIFLSQLWLAGKDEAGEIRLIQGNSGATYSDIFNGPISLPGTYTDPSFESMWGNSTWEICQSDIDTYKAWWSCTSGETTEGCDDILEPTNETLERIYNWPAHGDLSLEQSYYLAPYFDYNSDGTYNPDDGDYPIIKGCCAVYMIQNDAAQSHTYSNTDSLGIELHLMFYQYQTWDYLNDVTFVDLKAINRSSMDYSNFLTSIMVDADIGMPTDDSFGCDSASNTMYFYNADNIDQSDGGVQGYGSNPPAIGIVCLDAYMSSCVPYLGGSSAAEKYNLMSGLKADGTSWLDPNSNVTNYAYSGNPNVSDSWTFNWSNDVRGLASSRYGMLNSGDTITQTYAITFASNGEHIENVNEILNISNEIKAFYDGQSNQPCNGDTWGLNENNLMTLSLYPNPTNGVVNILKEGNCSYIIGIYDSYGRLINEAISKNDTELTMDLSEQPKGVYNVKVSCGEGAKVFKLILN